MAAVGPTEILIFLLVAAALVFFALRGRVPTLPLVLFGGLALPGRGGGPPVLRGRPLGRPGLVLKDLVLGASMDGVIDRGGRVLTPDP